MKKTKEVSSSKDLKLKLSELKNKIFEIKFQKHTSGISKPHELKVLKKDIARIMTTLNSEKK